MAKLKSKGRKHGRNKKWCEAYRGRGQREINKARKLKRHIARHPHDGNAWKVLDALPDAAKRQKAV